MNSNPVNFYTDAWRYDLVEGAYATGNFLDFYRRQISRYGEPVLELACGSGRLTIPLAEDGIDITGLDISKEMLALAKRKASERGIDIPFIRGDIRKFGLRKRFKFIFIPAQSLSHLHEQEEMEDCFSCVQRHLTKDGRFLIELFNPSLSLLSRNPDEAYPIGSGPFELPGGTGKVFVSCRARYDSAAQVNAIQFIYRHEPGGEEKVLSFAMRQFYPQEIDSLLSYNGFLIEYKYGDYHENQFSNGANKQLIVCKAK
jgi:SAM-dependent methyltransferase